MRFPVVFEVLAVLGHELLDGRRDTAPENGRASLVLGKQQVDSGRRLGVLRVARRTVSPGISPVCLRHLLDSLRVLGAEREPKPRIDERWIVRRHERVVLPEAPVDPGLRSRLVEISHRLRLADRVAGEPDPDVPLAPGLSAWRADQVAGRLTVGRREPAGGVVCPPLVLDVSPEIRDVGQERFRLSVRAMALGQQGGGGIEVLVREGLNVQLRHSRRTIASEERCPRP